MGRLRNVLLLLLAAGGVSLFAAACGTQKISVASSKGAVYQGAVLFNEHCSGCHTLSYAAAHGSAANVRTREYTNGPNFNVRCERPVARILYAIANGGFSGAIMPQNIVVGQEAIDVARFVANYSGRQAPSTAGAAICQKQPVGTVPNFSSATQTVTGVSTPNNGNIKQTVTTSTINTKTGATPPSTTTPGSGSAGALGKPTNKGKGGKTPGG